MGGTCDVFRAWSTKHQKKVAVKRIRRFLLEDMSFANNLGRELRLWSRLKHDNVLPLLGFFLDGPKAFPNLISEWMERGTLMDYMKDSKIDALEICGLIRGIASGINYIHVDHSMIHSDLKSCNIFVADDGRPLIADFGLSVSTSSHSLVATTFHGEKGSLRWMARELHLETATTDFIPSHTKMTDMWAFGMVISEVLTGEIPYKSFPERIVPTAILRGELPREPDICLMSQNTVLHNLWEVAQDCWGSNPQSRPSALQVIKLIDGFMAGLHTGRHLKDRETQRLKERAEEREKAVQNIKNENDSLILVPGSRRADLPGEGSATPTASQSLQAKNAARRVNDVEFAAEIGSNLLREVRRLQTLLGARDEMIQTLTEEKYDLVQTVQNMQSSLREQQEDSDKFKEENWNLEVTLQEMRTRLHESQASLRLSEVEEGRLTKALASAKLSPDATKSEDQKPTAKRNEVEAKNEIHLVLI